jgi:hypothetical protein
VEPITEFVPDSPLEEGVTSELVSEAQFPASREFTGNFIESGLGSASTAAKKALNQNLTGQFPTHPNREFFTACREFKSAIREISALIRESRSRPIFRAFCPADQNSLVSSAIVRSPLTAAGLARDAIYLLRPDTYVALAGASGEPDALDRGFLCRRAFGTRQPCATRSGALRRLMLAGAEAAAVRQVAAAMQTCRTLRQIEAFHQRRFGPGGGHQRSSWALSPSSGIRVSGFLLFAFGLC